MSGSGIRVDVLRVVGGARLAYCNLSWLHTRWWFSLVPDPIIYAPLSVVLGEDVEDVEYVKRIVNQSAGRKHMKR